MGDDRDRGEREKLSWSEIDKLRDRARSPRADRPQGRQARQRAERQRHETLRAADALFVGDKGGVPVNKVISARSHLRRPASDGRMDGKSSQRFRILRQASRLPHCPERCTAARGLAA